MNNARMDEYSERDWALYPGLRRIKKIRDDDYEYEEVAGIVKHELGVALFWQYREFGGREYKHLTITIFKDGRELTRSWNAWYGEKTIARLANEFIEEVKNG